MGGSIQDEKTAAEKTPYDVTDEKPATFLTVDDDPGGNLAAINTQMGIVEENASVTALEVSGAAARPTRPSTARPASPRLFPHSRTENSDGTFGVQRTQVDNDYVLPPGEDLTPPQPGESRRRDRPAPAGLRPARAAGSPGA